MAELAAGDFLDDALSVKYGKIWQTMAAIQFLRRCSIRALWGLEGGA